jgi:hypothetical protein
MLQESTQVQWDPVYIGRAPSTGLKIYLLCLVITCLVTAFKLVKLWRVVPPFSTKSPIVASAYIELLQVSANRFMRWIGLVFIASGLLTSTSIYNTCGAMLEEKRTGLAAIVSVVQDFSAAVSMGMLVVLFLYLARWHVLTRIERFHQLETAIALGDGKG